MLNRKPLKFHRGREAGSTVRGNHGEAGLGGFGGKGVSLGDDGETEAERAYVSGCAQPGWVSSEEGHVWTSPLGRACLVSS